MDSIKDLPIAQEMLNNPNKVFGAIHKYDNIKDYYHCQPLQSLAGVGMLEQAIYFGKWAFYATDFAIIDTDGNVCYRNNDNIKVSTDKNGYVHIDDDKYLIKININPEDERSVHFLGAANFEELNNITAGCISHNLLAKPRDFGPNGFIKTPIYEKAEAEPSTLGE